MTSSFFLWIIQYNYDIGNGMGLVNLWNVQEKEPLAGRFPAEKSLNLPLSAAYENISRFPRYG